MERGDPLVSFGPTRNADAQRLTGRTQSGHESRSPIKLVRKRSGLRNVLDRDPEAVIFVDPRLVGTVDHVAPPIFMVKVPADGLAEPGLESDAASTAEFAGQFCGVDRVAVS